MFSFRSTKIAITSQIVHTLISAILLSSTYLSKSSCTTMLATSNSSPPTKSVDERTRTVIVDGFEL